MREKEQYCWMLSALLLVVAAKVDKEATTSVLLYDRHNEDTVCCQPEGLCP